MDNYNPGLHIVASFSAPRELLTDAAGCSIFFDDLIEELRLTKVGEVYHSFPNDSFTAVLGLTESHLSVHTWPEHMLVTFDVYLSNFREDNTEKVRRIYEETLRYFKGKEISKQEISR